MRRSTTYRAEAVVLRRHDFGETDRILTLYTPTHGKLRAIAKGVRRITSRRSGHIELLTRVKSVFGPRTRVRHTHPSGDS